MDDRDPDLYQTVSRLSERVSTLEQRVGDTFSVVDQTTSIMRAVGGRLDSLDQSMTRLAITVTHELSEQNRCLEGFENRMTGFENRMVNMETRMVGMENRMTGFENRMANMETRMTGFETNLSEFRREFGDKLERSSNRLVGYMALMFGAVGVIVGLIAHF